jgi:hypothetical protein
VQKLKNANAQDALAGIDKNDKFMMIPIAVLSVLMAPFS